jgi:hypothetical protein
MIVRSEETRRSVTYQIKKSLDDRKPCDISMTLTVSCQKPGSRRAVEDAFTSVRRQLEDLLSASGEYAEEPP